MAQLRYRVHGITAGTQIATVMFEGAPLEASIPNVIIELTYAGQDGRDHGSLTLKFTGADVAWASQTFTVDGLVDADFTKVAGPVVFAGADDQSHHVAIAEEASAV